MTATQDGCATSTRSILEAGQLALAEARRLWRLDVYDPKANDHSEAAERSRSVIESILTQAGWTWQVPYKGDGQVEWCGLFAATCWRTAGLDPRWLATYFASTYRLDIWARYRSFDERHPNPRPEGEGRLICDLAPHSTSLPFEPQAGDILMIGDGAPAFGDHITIVESYEDGVFRTYEGNGMGLGPDGKRRQGIVRAERKLGGTGYCARRLIRPAASDLL